MASLVAVDTNLLVRLVTNDDPEQAEIAAAVVDGGEPLDETSAVPAKDIQGLLDQAVLCTS